MEAGHMAFDLVGEIFSLLMGRIVPGWISASLLSLFLVGYLAHFFRHRADSPEQQVVAGTGEIAGNTPLSESLDIPVDSFDRAQRAIHWLFAAILIFLTATGFEIYLYPNVVGNVLTVFSLIYHSDISAILLLLIIAHVFYDLRKPRSMSNMNPSNFDLKMLLTRTRNFLIPKREATALKSGKYDVFMKGYHWSLTGLLVVLGITGVYFWDPYAIVSAHLRLSLSMQSLLLNVHILSAVVVTGMMIGHAYFALIKVNRPILRSMLYGKLDSSFYSRHYDPNLWAPNVVVVKSSILMRLTRSLSDTAFAGLTGYKNRRILGSRNRFPVPFAAIQKTCGNHFYGKGVGRCRAKNGALCSPDKCPAIGTFVTETARVERRKALTKIATGAVAVSVLALGVGSAIKVLTSARRSEDGGNRQPITATQSQTTGSPKPLANIKTMADNSAVGFYDSQGYPDILIRLANGSLNAYSAICTHTGCLVSYDSADKVIFCPCHGAIFDPTNGSVLRGPAYIPLPTVSIRIDQATGNVFLG
ncbi:MAG: cytochrome b/b6 domain-containing protein [Nitrososphaerales archaeon]